MAKKKIISEVPPLGASAVFGLPEPPARKATDYIKAYRSWVYPAVTMIAQAVATVDLKLYKKKIVRKEPVTEEILEHPALSLLHYVNNFTTQYQLFELTQTYLELMGEAFWALIRESGKIAEIWALRPDWVKVHPSKKDIVSHYTYLPFGSGNEVRLEREDVIPFKQINPENPYRGYGAMKAAAMAMDINDFSDQWQRAFFYNSAMPSIIFTTDQNLNEKTITRFMKSWEAKYGGPKKAHQIAFLGGGLKPDYVPASAKDMDFVNLQTWTRDKLLATFGVSKANIGIVEDVNRANQEATDARFVKHVVKPKMISLVTQLNEFMLPLYKDTENLFFDFEDPVPPDREMDLQYYENGLKYGWLMINEVRQRENLDEVEGGDAIYLPFNLQPIGSALEKIKGFFGKKSEEQQGVITLSGKKSKKRIKHNIPIPPKRLQSLHKELEEKRLKTGIRHDLIKLVSQVMAEKKDPAGEKAVFWKNLIAQTDVWEESLSGLIRQLFRDQKEEVIGKITGTKAFKKKSVNEFLFGLTKENTKWLGAIIPFLKNIMAMRGRQVLHYLGIDAEVNLNTEGSVEFIEVELGKMITGINEYTRERIEKTLLEGIEREEGIPELTTRVKEIFDIADTTRAKTIARTETLRASNYATEEAYRQSGVVEGKEWLTALDERTCQSCAPMDGEQVYTNQFFTDPIGQFGQVKSPPLHPNCRCTIVPVLKGEMPKGLKPISQLRKGHGQLKKLENKELELKTKIDELERILQGKYQELEKELPVVKEKIIAKEKEKMEIEKDDLLAELKELRQRAQEVLNEE